MFKQEFYTEDLLMSLHVREMIKFVCYKLLIIFIIEG